MWFYSLFFCLSFVLIAESLRKKKEDTIDEKVRRLTEWSYKKPIIHLNGDKFRRYVKSAPRNYSIVVMMTALKPQRHCGACKLAYDEYLIVANSWRYSKQFSSQLFFALVDYDEGSDVFHSMKVNTAPLFFHFPAKGKPKREDTMEIERTGLAAEMITRWVIQRTSMHFDIYRPPNYIAILSVAAVICILGGILYLKRNNLQFFYNRTGWAVIAVAVIFAMISGQMWNHIRTPPLMHKDHRTGQTQYIYTSSQGQFIIETYIVMLLNCAVLAGFIMLNEATSLKWNVGKKKILALVGLACVAIFFSLLLSVFRSKHGEYPYSFLFK